MRKAQGTRAEIADSLCVTGCLGQKTGKGFYRSGARLAHAASRGGSADRRGVAAPRRRPAGLCARGDRRAPDLSDISEGAHILEQGIAPRAGDIDDLRLLPRLAGLARRADVHADPSGSARSATGSRISPRTPALHGTSRRRSWRGSPRRTAASARSATKIPV
jgi:hypothetical protein